jgi:hypothetical protein
MKILRNAGMWTAVGGLMLALGSSAWSQQTGSGSGSGSGNGGTGTQHGTMSGQGTGSLAGQGTDASSPSGRSMSPLSPIPGEDTTLSPQTETEQAKLRNAERQKKLQEDTAKLLSLANELKLDVDKSTKDTLSLDVVRKADEIEKLAHSVKEKMKGI